jgi:hypothetical protein
MITRLVQLAAAAIAVAAATAAAAATPARRLPRGYTAGHFCSACRAISAEVYAAYARAPEGETVDSGSFRLSESGKQAGRLRVPLRQSHLHATAVLDAACADIAARHVLFPAIAPDVFVPAADVDRHGLRANATADAPAVRALRSLCDALLDEHYDALAAAVRAAPLAEGEWTGAAPALCDGESGLFAACDAAAHPPVRLAADVVAVARAEKVADDAHRAALGREGDSAAEPAGSAAAAEGNASGGGGGGGGSAGGAATATATPAAGRAHHLPLSPAGEAAAREEL